MDLLNSENLDTNVSGMLSNMSGRKRYSNRDAKFQPFVMYRNADGEVVLSSEPVLTSAPAETTTSPTRSSTTTETITLTPIETAPLESTTTPILSTAPIETAPLESTTTPILSTATTSPTRSSTTTETITLTPITEPAPTPRSVLPTSETVTVEPTYSAPRPLSTATPIQPIIINTTPLAPTSFPVSTSSIPRTSMPMGGGGGGGVAPSESEAQATEIAKMEDTTKAGMSKGAKLAIFGLLAVGGYFAWKYRDMIFKK